MRKILLVVLSAVLLGSVWDCSSAPTVRFEPVPAKGSARFMREVVDKKPASTADGFAVALILIDKYGQNQSPEEQLEVLVKENVVPAKWQTEVQPAEALTRGRLASLLTGALKINGGLTVRIFGNSGRYALRECIERKLIEKGSSSSPVSGRELVSVLSNAEEYKTKTE